MEFPPCRTKRDKVWGNQQRLELFGSLPLRGSRPSNSFGRVTRRLRLRSGQVLKGRSSPARILAFDRDDLLDEAGFSEALGFAICVEAKNRTAIGIKHRPVGIEIERQNPFRNDIVAAIR